MTSNQLPTKGQNLETHFVDDQVVVYDMNHDNLHYLNPTAALVFELCDGTHSASQIVDLVRDAYNLPEPPLAEVMNCLAKLSAAGIVR